MFATVAAACPARKDMHTAIDTIALETMVGIVVAS